MGMVTGGHYELTGARPEMALTGLLLSARSTRLLPSGGNVQGSITPLEGLADISSGGHMNQRFTWDERWEQGDASLWGTSSPPAIEIHAASMPSFVVILCVIYEACNKEVNTTVLVTPFNLHGMCGPVSMYHTSFISGV